MHLHSIATRKEQLRMNEDILIRKERDTSVKKISGRYCHNYLGINHGIDMRRKQHFVPPGVMQSVHDTT